MKTKTMLKLLSAGLGLGLSMAVTASTGTVSASALSCKDDCGIRNYNCQWMKPYIHCQNEYNSCMSKC